MVRCLLSFVLANAAVCGVAADPEPPVSLDGDWKLVAVTNGDGSELTAFDIETEPMSCTIKGKLMILRKGEIVTKMTITVNGKALPVEIDFFLPDGKGTNHGICAVEKGKLVLGISTKWEANKKTDRMKAFDPTAKANRHLPHKMRLTFQHAEAK